MTHHTLIWFRWIEPVVVGSVQFIIQKMPQKQLFLPENNYTFDQDYGIFLISHFF